ncbi:hypothetical protein P171DRAFT_417105 [Karstenula rhodostoma CBS 690.94]|uniref:Uncharacterized protein n=1 Tax=Karstenula rhodostoma CBS 690.94 TaxID=1392251 RepID=A0A9P4U9M8_9PLEO|nr:hypothetical protein P171DRAFT_417105 [Karstenula rhodostoma CBS 690.94]
MFKPQVFRRSFSLFRRTPTSTVVKSVSQHGNEAIRIQRVRIQKRVFTTSRLAGSAVVAVGFWKLLDWLNEEIEDEEELQQQHRRARRPPIPGEDANDKGGREITDEEEGEWEEQDDEEEEDEGLIFLPTGFSRPRPRSYYRGSDPEWQTFVRLAQDRPRVDKIRGELVTTVRDLATKNPRFTFLLGKIDPTKGSIWIEVKFPDGPPLEYERPGIQLTEDLTFRKATQMVDSLHHKKLANVLMPTAVANSVYSDMKMRLHASWLNLRKYAGFEVKQSPVQNMFKGLPPSPGMPTPTTQTPVAPSTPGAPAAADAEKQAQPPSPSLPTNPTLEKLGLTLPDPGQAPTMNLAYFRLMLMKYRKPMAIEPPRGTFLVTGLVEIIGEKAKMTLDVTAVYDPNMAKYVMLNSRARSMTKYKQQPRGGP